MKPGPAQRIDELRMLTGTLNLHVPPSYFASSTCDRRYEEAVAPILDEHAGPLHLYVGVPLCVEHCRFCMYFYGLADAGGTRAEACLRGLERFLAAIGTAGRPRQIAGSYIGGGTPTVLSAAQITRLVDAVNATFSFEPSAQRTFELSPTTASPGKVRAIVAGGYDRVSFGVQSFDPAVVSATGRTFVPPDDVARLVGVCVDAGVVEVNVDLMVGLSGESDDTLADSVASLLHAGCHTVSIYRYRPGRRSDLAERGGMDRYVRRCAARVRNAVSVARRAGWSASGRLDGEHVRLLAGPAARWPVRNLYETRFQPDLANSLVGIGVASWSFLRNEWTTRCPYRASLGYELVGRPGHGRVLRSGVESCRGAGQRLLSGAPGGPVADRAAMRRGAGSGFRGRVRAPAHRGRTGARGVAMHGRVATPRRVALPGQAVLPAALVVAARQLDRPADPMNVTRR
jgi:coproporphyrinogen III oxidase-like Fe-S oxidoreductase